MISVSEPILLNVTYIRPKESSNGEGYFEVIYKDKGNNVYKSHEPELVDIYFTKPEFRNHTHNLPSALISTLDKRRVPYSKILNEIARDMGEEGMEFMKRCRENMRLPFHARDPRYKINKLYGHRYSYRADFQPEFYFMDDWYKKYKLQDASLTKAFKDIETDGIDYMFDLDNIKDGAVSPVNLITIFIEETSEMVTFILNPYVPPRLGRTEEEYKERYALYENQKKDHDDLMRNLPMFVKSLEEEFEPTYGKINYVIRNYNSEIELITDSYRLIHSRKPNFCMMWNMRFDSQYLVERIKFLGYDPSSIICHPEFESQKCYFKVDNMTHLLEKQTDYFYCSSYTHYLCQMRLYASIRKSQNMLKSVSLNAVGDIELGDQKVDYPPETSFAKFAYVDWVKFIRYNIKDVLIQIGIERNTNDVMTYYIRSHKHLTPYSKAFRETHLLRNVREDWFNRPETGRVQGNNLNLLKDKKEVDNVFYEVTEEVDDDGQVTFKGAIMANPLMNSNKGVNIYRQPSRVLFNNAADADMAGFYPACKEASNMDPITLIGKGSLINDEFISGSHRNRSLNQVYDEKDKHGKMRKVDVTGEAINTYMTGWTMTFGFQYLSLPSPDTIIREVRKRLKPNDDDVA